MTILKQQEIFCTRAEALVKLRLCKTSLNNYCNALGIPCGLRYFTESEFQRLVDLRAWTLRGCKISDFKPTRVFDESCA